MGCGVGGDLLYPLLALLGCGFRIGAEVALPCAATAPFQVPSMSLQTAL